MIDKSEVRNSLVYSCDNVLMTDQKETSNHIIGSVHLYLQELTFSKKNLAQIFSTSLDKLLCVEKLPMTTKGSPMSLKTKTFLLIVFIFSKDKECIEFCQQLEQHIPRCIEQLPCFCSDTKEQECFLSLKEDYEKMGLPTEEWKLFFNDNLCQSYPDILFVPLHSNLEILKGSANFRSGKRLPVLTYLHENGAALCRSSQPLVGFSGRCTDDEIHLKNIASCSPGEKIVYIADARPMINAMANKAQGKGYESERLYVNVSHSFLGVENIHVIRESLHRIVFCFNEITPSLAGDWLKHVMSVIEAANFVVNKILSKTNVLVHCSDGWDRTSQICSLASLILQPRYRTIDGFKNLICRDWLAFGFRFTDRCQHLYNSDLKEAAPIFLLFLDCVWQICQLNPTAFEFNERLLILLHEYTVSCSYGDFVGNNQIERLNIQKHSVSPSIWRALNEHEKSYIINPFFKNGQQLLKIPTLKTCRFWWRMYYRFSTQRVRPADSLTGIALRLKRRIQFLKFLKKNKLDSLEFVKSEGCDVSRLLSQRWSNYMSGAHCECSEFFDSIQSFSNCCMCGCLCCLNCVKNTNSMLEYSVCKTCHSTINMNEIEAF